MELTISGIWNSSSLFVQNTPSECVHVVLCTRRKCAYHAVKEHKRRQEPQSCCCLDTSETLLLSNAIAMESVSPSNHQTTAAKLRSAGITLKRRRQQPPLDFDTEWRRFASLCGSTTVNASAAWTALQGTISESYSGELEFDMRLYSDVMELLGGSVQRVSDRLHLLSNNATIGIARQVQREDDLGFHPNYGLTADTDATHHQPLYIHGATGTHAMCAHLR